MTKGAAKPSPNSAQATEPIAEDPNPTPPVVRVGRLTSLRNVRRELARLYADLRNYRVSSRIAGTGAYILTAITKTLEVEVLEERVDQLEERAEMIAAERKSGVSRARH